LTIQIFSLPSHAAAVLAKAADLGEKKYGEGNCQDRQGQMDVVGDVAQWERFFVGVIFHGIGWVRG
jgi:hypothetical protein